MCCPYMGISRSQYFCPSCLTVDVTQTGNACSLRMQDAVDVNWWASWSHWLPQTSLWVINGEREKKRWPTQVLSLMMPEIACCLLRGKVWLGVIAKDMEKRRSVVFQSFTSVVTKEGSWIFWTELDFSLLWTHLNITLVRLVSPVWLRPSSLSRESFSASGAFGTETVYLLSASLPWLHNLAQSFARPVNDLHTQWGLRRHNHM